MFWIFCILGLSYINNNNCDQLGLHALGLIVIETILNYKDLLSAITIVVHVVHRSYTNQPYQNLGFKNSIYPTCCLSRLSHNFYNNSISIEVYL